MSFSKLLFVSLILSTYAYSLYWYLLSEKELLSIYFMESYKLLCDTFNDFLIKSLGLKEELIDIPFFDLPSLETLAEFKIPLTYILVGLYAFGTLKYIGGLKFMAWSMYAIYVGNRVFQEYVKFKDEKKALEDPGTIPNTEVDQNQIDIA
jgi:hypothetical protein